MATAIEAQPQPQPGLGCCLGKGCLILVALFFFLILALAGGAYFGLRTFTSQEPRRLPPVETTEEKQQEVLQRWDNFENAVHEARATPERAEASSPNQTTVPNNPEAKPSIELTAGDINQLIAANHRSRGKAFVTIENGVGHVSISIPISKKMNFSGRYLNADVEVRSAPNGDLSGIQFSVRSPRGVQVPSRLLGFMSGSKSLQSLVSGYVSEYRSEYDVTSLKIVDSKVVIEAGLSR